jgi:hypothetical protein
MSKTHEPRDAFVSALEDRLRADLAQRSLTTPAPRWLPRSTRGLALATAALVLVSMAIGGGVVAAAYQAQQNELRDMLVGTYEQRLALARQRLEIARQQLQEAEGRAQTGVDTPAAAREARVKATEAEAEVRLGEIDLVEVRATGREPMKSVAAPLVSGRDLVSDRWRVEMSAKQAALEDARLHAQAAKARFAVGLAAADEVEAASARPIEIEAWLQLQQQRLTIRQTFLSGAISAAAADLRVLEAETDQRRVALARRLDVARRQMADIAARVEIGTAAPLEVAQAELRLLELQLALKKAEYDLALIRKQKGK